MKLNVFIASLCGLFLLTVNISVAENIDKKSPHAVLPEQIFEFEPVIEGTIITHDFILQNKGMAPLVIHKIKIG
jgi:hypothetical protein